MNEHKIPPLCGMIRNQLHYPTWNWIKIFKAIFIGDLKEKITELNNCKYVVLTDSGSTALTLGLQYLKHLSKNDKVMMPSYCCKTVANAVLNAGLEPHFIDITKDLQPKPTNNKCLATIVPHFHGNKAPIHEFKGIIIDDKAQRIQDPLQGTFGILSFNIGKQIQSTGGGALITNNKELATFAETRLRPQTKLQTLKNLTTFILTVNLRKPTMFIYNILIKTKILKREEDIRKRYEEVNKKRVKFKPRSMNWIQQTLTHAQLDDLSQILTQKHHTILTKYRYQTMKEITKTNTECDWSWLPLHLQSKFSNYSKEKLTNTEKLWKQTITIRTK